MSRILILDGSPNAKGNTNALITCFTEGAKSSGNIVSRLNIRDMNINPCVGCLGGDSAACPLSPCCQKDDMDQIYRGIAENDIVVFASPIYYWNFPSQFKAAIDRMIAIVEGNPAQHILAGKKLMLLMCCEEAHNKRNESGVQIFYRNFLEYYGIEGLGVHVFGGMMGADDYKKHPEALIGSCLLGAMVK